MADITPEDSELLQEKILEICHAAGLNGMPDERIKRTLIQASYGIDDATLDRQLRYLKSKAWIELVPSAGLRPDIRRWQSTALGDEYLMKKGLAKI
jgi:hypothetical protein